MANQIIRIPLQRVVKGGHDVYRIDFGLDIRVAKGNRYSRVPFRLDSATDFTTIPISLATSMNISYVTTQPIYPHTAAGRAKHPSYLSPIWFSFSGLPQLRFQSVCMFSPYNLKVALFSLRDRVPNFLIRSRKATPSQPDGFVILQLRKDHNGQLRP